MKNIKNKVKAIIFDMDGTIIKTEEIWINSIKRILTKRNITKISKAHTKMLDNSAGMGLTPGLQILKDAFNLPESVYDLVHETKMSAIADFKKGVSFIPGFEDFHKKLRDYLIPTSIATNADEISLSMLSAKLNLPLFFGQNIYHIGHVQNKTKPDPAVFLHAAKQLGVNPQECIVFEDSLAGFGAAKAANMKCIAIKNNVNKKYIHQVHGAIDSYFEAEEEILKVFK